MLPDSASVAVDWPATRPADWAAREARLRAALRAAAGGTPFEGRLLAVVVGLGATGYFCERIYAPDSSQDCPLKFEHVVDDVLARSGA